MSIPWLKGGLPLIQQDETSADIVSLRSKSRRFIPAVHDFETLDSLTCGALDDIVFRRHQNDPPSSRINAPSHFQPIRTHYVFQIRVSIRAQQSNEPFGAVGGLINSLKSFDGQIGDRLRVNSG